MAGLQFNDTTNKNGLLQDCEFLLNLGDGTITSDSSSAALTKVFTRLINQWYHKIITMIFAAQDEWEWDDINNTDYPIATTSLVANQQDYVMPASLGVLRIKRVEVSYDGGTTWKRCMPFNINQTDNATDTSSIASNFDTTNPFYDIEFNAIKLYPIPTANSTNGLKIWFYRTAIEFVSTDTTKQPAIDAPFHRMLSVGASYDYAMAKNMPQVEALASMLQDYELRLRQYYGTKDEDRRMNMGSIYNDSYGS